MVRKILECKLKPKKIKKIQNNSFEFNLGDEKLIIGFLISQNKIKEFGMKKGASKKKNIFKKEEEVSCPFCKTVISIDSDSVGSLSFYSCKNCSAILFNENNVSMTRYFADFYTLQGFGGIMKKCFDFKFSDEDSFFIINNS